MLIVLSEYTWIAKWNKRYIYQFSPHFSPSSPSPSLPPSLQFWILYHFFFFHYPPALKLYLYSALVLFVFFFCLNTLLWRADFSICYNILLYGWFLNNFAKWAELSLRSSLEWDWTQSFFFSTFWIDALRLEADSYVRAMYWFWIVF